MSDIVPGLLKNIQKDFTEACQKDSKLKRITQLILDGKATYDDAQDYAIRLGENLSYAYTKNIRSDDLPDGTMYYNIANRILQPTLAYNHEMISSGTERIQKALNEESGIGLAVEIPDLNQDRIDGLINRISSEPFEDVSWLLESPVVNFCQSVVDDAVEKNCAVQKKAGLNPKIVRKMAGDCCDWCRKLAGTYDYSPDMDRTIFRRHENCQCTVTFVPGDGKTAQDVHTKKWISNKSEIERRIRMSEPKVLQDYFTGPFAKSLSDNHREQIQKFLDEAPENIRKVWLENCEYLKFTDANASGRAYYDSVMDGVTMNLEKDAQRETPYSTFFHEFGHQIDFVSGRSDKTINELKVIPSSCKTRLLSNAIDKDIANHLNRIALQNGSVYVSGDKKGQPKITKQVKIAWLKELSSKYSSEEVCDLSDMIEHPLGITGPLGWGHGLSYYKPKHMYGSPEARARKRVEYALDRRCKEGFAEFFSATISNPDSLKCLQEVLPNGYTAFLELLGEMQNE